MAPSCYSSRAFVCKYGFRPLEKRGKLLKVLDFIAMVCVVTTRHFGVAFLFYWLCYEKDWCPHRRLDPRTPKRRIIRIEVAWSLVSNLILATVATLVWEAWGNGKTLLYEDHLLSLYVPVSFLFALCLQDTYFYFTHRLLHLPFFYRQFHRIHHLSHNPNPWTAFAFHPIETLIESLLLAALPFILPMHIFVYLAIATSMTLFSVTNHVGFELYPRALLRSLFFKIWITPTHHEAHHLRNHVNFGLYFRIWDRVLGTESPDYERQFDRITASHSSRVNAKSLVI